MQQLKQKQHQQQQRQPHHQKQQQLLHLDDKLPKASDSFIFCPGNLKQLLQFFRLATKIGLKREVPKDNQLDKCPNATNSLLNWFRRSNKFINTLNSYFKGTYFAQEDVLSIVQTNFTCALAIHLLTSMGSYIESLNLTSFS